MRDSSTLFFSSHIAVRVYFNLSVPALVLHPVFFLHQCRPVLVSPAGHRLPHLNRAASFQGKRILQAFEK